MKKIRKLLNSQKTIFPDKEFRYLSDVDYQKSSFYSQYTQVSTIKGQISEVVNIKKLQVLKVKPITRALKGLA